jgi:thiol-disulfide isomerase/thioredoxin
MDGWTGVIVAVAALVLASGLGILARARRGRFTSAAGSAVKTTDASPHAVMLAGLGVTPGTPVTLLQFSSAFCAPCRATRVLCAAVAGQVPGVRHVEVDAESNLDAVRAFDVWRTPTVLLVDGSLNVRRRASGAPTRDQLLAAVADLLPTATANAPDVRVA